MRIKEIAATAQTARVQESFVRRTSNSVITLLIVRNKEEFPSGEKYHGGIELIHIISSRTSLKTVKRLSLLDEFCDLQ